MLAEALEFLLDIIHAEFDNHGTVLCGGQYPFSVEQHQRGSAADRQRKGRHTQFGENRRVSDDFQAADEFIEACEFLNIVCNDAH